MLDLKAQLERYQAQLDEMFPSITIDDLDPADLEVSSSTYPVRLSRRVYAFGLAFALVLILGIATVLMVSGDDNDPSEQPIVPDTTVTTTTVPATEAPSTTVVPPTTESPPPPPTTTTTTTPAPDPTALPIELSEATVAGALGSDGTPVVVYWSATDGAMMVSRCVDSTCARLDMTVELAALPTFEVEGDDAPPQVDGFVLLPDGSPIAAIWSADQTTRTLYSCSDPSCTSVRAEPLAAEGFDPQIGIGADGLPRILHWNVKTGNLELTVCGDVACSADLRTAVVIDPDVSPLFEPSLRIDDAGRLFATYTAQDLEGGEPTAKVVVCADDRCSEGSGVVAFDGAVGPQVTQRGEGGFDVWFRRGPEIVSEGDLDTELMLSEWQLVKVGCDEGGCGDELAVVAPWALLHKWDEADVVAVADGGAAFVYSYWAQDVCAQYLDVAWFDPMDSASVRELGHHPGGPILIVEALGDGSLYALSVDELSGRLQWVIAEFNAVDSSAGAASSGCP